MTEKQALAQREILKRVDEGIARGPYSETWESLCGYKVPEWYKDAKFGIFIHWGVYAVPAFGNEWYPRHMYLPGTPEYEHHQKTYGDQKAFGYKDFIGMFKAEKFDAAEWMQLFQDAGAKYVMPVAEHHDGFQMYRSELSGWNASEMGPKRDVLAELKREADARGIEFCASDHRAEHCWFFNGGLTFDSDVPENPEFYDVQVPYEDSDHAKHDLYAPVPPQAHLDNWLARLCELVDNYRPRVVWFDWWIQQVAFRPYLRKFAAYYYNRAAEWGVGVAINYKYASYMLGSAVFDVERGQLDAIRPELWQTDTAIAKNSWGYTENNDFKNPVDIVGDLIDIVSKNGVLLLNVGPRADGTITEEDRHVLLEIGKWLKRYGEGIYKTRPWTRFGEGPTRIKEGAFSDVDRAPFTPEDIRYTFKPGRIYAYCMKRPQDGLVRLKALGRCFQNDADYDVKAVRLLGGGAVPFERDEAAMTIRIQPGVEDEYPVALPSKSTDREQRV
jgi:alpha-L-fucosidase